ncbi:MAG TPA: hypothetical protein PLP20_03930 [Oscillospiraceae bacterium]|nr:hypothetical protein [Oscillospiraceae bacterium]HNW04336.1 hypothetical protein [Oscillospiraceae bacterium]HPW00190.1 hypothetical protein [Oscillospiraceae bacterium]
MKKVTIAVDDFLYQFYEKIGERAGGIKPERVMADALLKLAGELSVSAIYEKNAGEAKAERAEESGLPE